MNARMRQFLERLLDARAPSGHETAAAAAWRAEAEPFADRVWEDVYGNVFAEVRGEQRPTVMLAGHIDEIGLMVHHVDDDGYLYVKTVGGWDPQVLVGQRVEILTAGGTVGGVVGRKAPHLMEEDDRQKAVKVKELWIDIGASEGEEARSRVDVGDVAVIRSSSLELGPERLAARSIDDRIGALIALDALRRAREMGTTARTVAVATAQEEIGARTGGGARTSSYGLEPDAAVVIDVTHATDHPGMDRKEHGDVRLGRGPVLSRGPVVNPVLFRRLVEAAGKAGVSYQVLAAPSATGTDADNIFTTRSGVATAVVSIPNRYMHSPNQLVDLGDVEAAAELIATFLAGLSVDADFLPG